MFIGDDVGRPRRFNHRKKRTRSELSNTIAACVISFAHKAREGTPSSRCPFPANPDPCGGIWIVWHLPGLVRRHASHAPVETDTYHGAHEGCCAEGEDAAVTCHEPVPA